MEDVIILFNLDKKLDLNKVNDFNQTIKKNLKPITNPTEIEELKDLIELEPITVSMKKEKINKYLKMDSGKHDIKYKDIPSLLNTENYANFILDVKSEPYIKNKLVKKKNHISLLLNHCFINNDTRQYLNFQRKKNQLENDYIIKSKENLTHRDFLDKVEEKFKHFSQMIENKFDNVLVESNSRIYLQNKILKYNINFAKKDEIEKLNKMIVFKKNSETLVNFKYLQKIILDNHFNNSLKINQTISEIVKNNKIKVVYDKCINYSKYIQEDSIDE